MPGHKSMVVVDLAEGAAASAGVGFVVVDRTNQLGQVAGTFASGSVGHQRNVYQFLLAVTPWRADIRWPRGGDPVHQGLPLRRPPQDCTPGLPTGLEVCGRGISEGDDKAYTGAYVLNFFKGLSV